MDGAYPNAVIAQPAPAPVPDGPEPGLTATLRHPAFHRFVAPRFRKSETDGGPMLVVRLGDREASMSLDAVRRQLGLAEDTEDGRMLRLIARSLDFVPCLEPGDALPSEVLTGQASWSPDGVHAQIAFARLRLGLMQWLTGEAGGAAPRDAATLLSLADTPEARRQVQEAIARAATALGLPDSDAVLEAIEDLAGELAYFEALRDRLLRRVQRMTVRIAKLGRPRTGDTINLDTLLQVQRLSVIGCRELEGRFARLDAQNTAMPEALREVAARRGALRRERDLLYRGLLAWTPILDAWDHVGQGLNEGVWALLRRTYQFLAPRYMPVTEWSAILRNKPSAGTARPMVW